MNRAAVVLLAVLGGCKPQPAAVEPLPAPPTEVAGAKPVAYVELPECEKLAALWSRCTENLPADEREQVLQDIESSVEGWRDDAFNEEARRSIEDVCHTTLVSMDGGCTLPEDAEADADELPAPPEITDDDILALPIGVPQCDAYVADFLGCVGDKLPPEIQTQARQALYDSVVEWRGLAETPDGQKGLAAACTAGREAITESCGFEPPAPPVD